MTAHIEILVTWLRARSSSQRGASLIEYALLVALIAVVCVAAVTTFGGATNKGLSSGVAAFPN
jgi:pilus assembly protein Flp/PilA